MSYPRWSTSLVVNKQFWSDQSAVDQNDTMRLYGVIIDKVVALTRSPAAIPGTKNYFIDIGQ